MPPTLTRLPYTFARANGILLERVDADGGVVVVRAGIGSSALGELRRELGVPLKVEAVADDEFERRLAAVYAPSEHAGVRPDEAGDAALAELAQSLATAGDVPLDLLAGAEEAPVVRFVNGVLARALGERASDVHLEPEESRTVVRLRVDGVLREATTADRALHPALVSRIKIMAGLDIAEKRLPQDGRIRLRLAGRPVDVRVSTLPVAHGERVVLRLLDKASGRLDLHALGMSPDAVSGVESLLRAPQGIVLVTGPTGSGKTTTLYAALGCLDTRSLNVMTVEDPIEYDLEGVAQTPVNQRSGLTFARALRSILRQDPDVIMVGEIRDLDTAQVAIQASLTGHLVLATLHTGDASSSVTRLLDMGIESYLLASSLLGVVAQRLVRRVCPACVRVEAPTESERRSLQAAGMSGAVSQVARATGCPSCGGIGYRGRTGVYEVLTLTPELRRLVHDRAPEADLRAAVRAGGMRGLREDGVRWVGDRVTTIEEWLRASAE